MVAVPVFLSLQLVGGDDPVPDANSRNRFPQFVANASATVATPRWRMVSAVALVFLGLATGGTEVNGQETPSSTAKQPPAIDSPDAWQASYTRQKLVTADGTEHAYRLRFPDGFAEGETSQYPLVLLLHGAGERGSDNEAQLVHGAIEFARPERQGNNPCFVLVPQVPTGERWVDVDWSQPGGAGTFPDKDSPAFAAAIAMIKQWIEGGRVDPNRVYVTGLSMGGYGTWYAGAAHRDLFAAAAPICGGGDPSWAKRYAGLPIWAFHGSEDKAVPVVRTQEMIAALNAAGQQPPAVYTEYPGGGHDVWTQTFRRDDFFGWLFSQRRTDR